MNAGWLVAAAAVLVFGMAGSVQAGGDAAKGEAKSKACTGCHGADGKGKKDNPPLAGMPEADFAKAMQDYKSGARDHKAMVMFAKKLSDEDIANVAAYYVSLK